jgi:hypothetical protein
MNFKQNIYEEGPLGDGWILITGGSSEISKKKNEGCEVKKASDGKRYYKCPSNPNDDNFPEGYKCVTDGEKQKTNNGTVYYKKNINGVLWDFSYDGAAGKSDYPYWTTYYWCINGVVEFTNACDMTTADEIKGKDGDNWEYKKVTNTAGWVNYCTRKQGSQKWLHLEYGNPKHKKAYDAIKKKFETEVGNTEVSSGSTEVSSGSTEISSGSTVSSGSTITKYPSIAPQNIIDEFNKKYSCLSSLKTMVNIKDDVEYYYKVEMINDDEIVYYFMSGKCKIKKPTGVESKYYRCP